MNARNVQAVIAAGLQRPDLILRWREDPLFLSSRGIDPAQIDLTALWHFAGLGIKVRHNGLRLELPLTFRLMRVSELEIVVFSSYATYRARNGLRYAATSAERASDLLGFLEQWLDLGQRSHSLLWDMIRHEMALAELRRSMGNPLVDSQPMALDGASSLSGRSRPLVRGEIILHEMQCDPCLAESALFQRPPRLDQIPFACHRYCYWRAPGAEAVQIFGFDEFGYYTLKMIDGIQSVSDLSHTLTGTRRPSRKFLQALSQLAATGILTFQSSQDAANQ
jgi:hypothetical protein